MAGQIGFGVTLVGGTTGTIGRITKIEVGGQKCDSTDVTASDSADGFREFLPTLLDAGEITVEMNYSGAAIGAAKVLSAAFQAKTVQLWTVTFPDTSKWACSGFITNLGIPVDVEGKISQPVTIKCTGKPTFTSL